MRAQADRAAQMQAEDMEAWQSEQVGAIDSLALGWRPNLSNHGSYGGVKQLTV